MSDVVELTPPILNLDRECLRSWRRGHTDALRPVVERYLAFVYSSAYRRTGEASEAAEITRAVFFVLARRARKLRVSTVLADWLFKITRVASRNLTGQTKKRRRWEWFGAKPPPLPGATIWNRLAPELDPVLDKLPRKLRNAFLLRVVLNGDWDVVTTTLRTSEKRARDLVSSGLARVAQRFAKAGLVVGPEEIELACRAEARAAPGSEELSTEILESIRSTGRKRPTLKLARRVLSRLAWVRWSLRIAVGVPSVFACVATLGLIAWQIDSRTGHSRLLAAFLFWGARHEARSNPGMAEPARPWPTNEVAPRQTVAGLRSAGELYRPTNIWVAELKFSTEQWNALEPKKIGVLPNFLQKDGTVLLRNPDSQRSGLAGVLGLEFEWTHADFEFGGTLFTNVAVRFKGNGSYLGSLYGEKRPFKVDLNKFTKGQKLAGVSEFNFHNMVADSSRISDTLGYEFFREAGVPASRTAYAYLSTRTHGTRQHPLGLYVMAEPVNGAFMAERFGSKNVPLFKPVTYELFKYLGDDWSAYEAIYDLKTSATVAQRRRVLDFARLVTEADDAQFAAHLGDFVDLDEFSRFLAAQVW